MALKDEEKPAADEQRSEAKTEEPATEPATAAHAEEEAAASVEDATDRAAEAPAAKPAAGERTARPAPQQPRGAPGWIVPAYVTGLVLLYMGERILEASPTWRMVAVSAGLAAVLVATAARFVPSFRSGGERRDIERLLAVLSVTGLAALAMYLATTDFGSKLVGLSEAAYETRERVEGVLGVGWVMLLLISVVPMLFAETALRPMRQAERPESRRVRAAAAAGLTLVLAACYGALFVFVAGSTPVKADYSYFKTSRPSDSTRNIGAGLKDPVQVLAFFPQVNEVKSEVERYLSDLTQGLPKLKVQFHDRLLAPKLARDLRVNQDGVLVLKKGDTVERLEIGAELENARKNLKTLDRDFQERLLKMVRSRRVAYLTVGHGELNDDSRSGQPGRSARLARTLLEKQNYQVKNLGLTQGLGREIPEDASIVFVLGPTDPFTPEELATLERYLKGGGKLLLALDPDGIPAGDLDLAAAGAEPGPTVPASAGKDEPSVTAAKSKSNGGGAEAPKATTPAGDEEKAEVPLSEGQQALHALARLAGVEFGHHILANEQQHLRRRFNDSDRTLLMTNRFSSHPTVSTLSRNTQRGAAVVLSGAGSLDRPKGTKAKIDFAVRSLPVTFADENRNYQADADEKRSVYNIAAAVSFPSEKGPQHKDEEKPDEPAAKDGSKKDAAKAAKPDDSEARAFVLADADAVSDAVLANVLGNQVLFAEAVRWLGGEESFSGEVNSEEDIKIEHTKQQDLVWFYGTIFGAPALVLGLGLAYGRWSRRPRGAKR
ncbi:MAG TPA: Gldg family protein [Polyangiaceae bacterium]|nr:Gldg family protein [Polyangiaceae bacterium]